MRLSLHAVGRLKPGPEKELAGEYAARAEALLRQAGFKSLSLVEHAESQAATPAQRKAEEAQKLLARIPSEAFVVALDERGRELGSPDFAKLLGDKRDQGLPELAFVIGGPDGHGEALLARAGLTLAFGRLTWPHRLMRILLAEQLYRGLTILLNHPYHRA